MQMAALGKISTNFTLNTVQLNEFKVLCVKAQYFTKDISAFVMKQILFIKEVKYRNIP